MLKLENLKKVYDGVTILENINLDIEDGEIISILGPSGLSLIHISEPTRPY